MKTKIGKIGGWSPAKRPKPLFPDLLLTKGSRNAHAIAKVTVLRSAILESADDLQRIRPLWEELASQPGMTMFQSYVWNMAALKVFGAREIPRLVYVENDGGAVLVPSVMGRSCGMVHLAGEEMFDYRAALTVGDASVVCRAWERIADWGRPLAIKALREDQREPWSALPLKSFAKAPMVRARNSGADELVASKSRLARFSRRFRRQGIELRRHSGANRALVRRIYEKKAEQDVPGNLFRDPLRREFMMAIAAEHDAHCEIFTYELGSDLVAALVTFRDGNTRRFYTTYFDQRWAHQSPGQVLLFEVTAESLRENLDCDYMTGEHPYKNRFATDAVQLYEVHATPTQLRAAAEEILASRASLAA